MAALDTGCRLGELLSLRWRGVDLERNELTIRAVNAKARKERYIPIVSRLRAVLELVSLSDCRSVKTAVLVNKRNSRREPIQLDYVGFEVESGWVVGFGMDIDGELRDLDEIGVVDESDPGQPSSSRRRSKG